MSTAPAEGGRGNPTTSTRMDSDDSDLDSVSGSSYIGSDAPEASTIVCRWQDERYHDQECSRYFDCPSHIVERAPLSEDGEGSGERGHASHFSPDGHNSSRSRGREGEEHNEEHNRDIQGYNEEAGAQPLAAAALEPSRSPGLDAGDAATAGDGSSPPESQHTRRERVVEGALEGSGPSGGELAEPFTAVPQPRVAASTGLLEPEGADESSPSLARLEPEQASGTVPTEESDASGSSQPPATSTALTAVPAIANTTTNTSPAHSPAPGAGPREDEAGLPPPFLPHTLPYGSQGSSPPSPPPPSLLPDPSSSNAPATVLGEGTADGSGGPPPPAARRNAERRGAAPPSPTIVLPRWQPDAEVTLCPICHTQFSIFVRKHHCRKCGRVVCNSCSPHRITIPYQFIVQPLGTTPRVLAQRYPSSLISGEGGYADFSSLGGGERVRLCNPCVPDPNTSPPQQQLGGVGGGAAAGPRHFRSQSSAGGGDYAREAAGLRAAAGGRGRSITQHDGLPHHQQRQRQQQQQQPGSSQGQLLTGTPPPAYSGSAPTAPTPTIGPRPYPGGGRYSGGSRYRTTTTNPNSNNSNNAATAAQAGPSSPSSSSAATAAATAAAAAATAALRLRHRRSLPPVPQAPVLAEEDECPVCHRELPARTLPNFEALREAHISICITAHSTYGGSTVSLPAGSSPAAAGAAGEGSSSASGPGQGQQHGHHHNLHLLHHHQGQGHQALPPRPPPRRTGMFPYLATEKDCVDSAECTICLEEFEVGVPMARLECLCRFHRACISAWFVGHPGRCPVHQHDSFGY